MVITTARRSLALASAALLTTLSCAAAAHADPKSGANHGRHAGQAKHAAPTAQPTAAATPSSSSDAKAGNAPTKKPHPAHPANPGKGAGKGAGAPAPKPGAGDPPGNNGTVKIAAIGDLDRIPNNAPHPGCTFEVQWYGFDAGSDVVSTVSFTPQAPTKDVAISVDGPTSVPVGEDAASGAGTSTGLDAVQAYTLAFTGQAPAKQGYHVRLTVATPRSRGNDTKTKVFWVGPCDSASPAPASAPSGTPSAAPSPGQGTSPAPAAGSGAVGDSGQTTTGTPAADTAPGTAVQAAPPAADTAAAGAAVPTAVDAGKAHHGVAAWAHSPLPLVIAGLGALLGVLGLTRMRRRA